MKRISLMALLLTLTACGGGENTIPETTLPNITNGTVNNPQRNTSGETSNNTSNTGSTNPTYELTGSITITKDKNNNIVSADALSTTNYVYNIDGKFKNFETDISNNLVSQKNEEFNVYYNPTTKEKFSLSEYQKLSENEKSNLTKLKEINDIEILLAGNSVGLSYSDFGYWKFNSVLKNGSEIVSNNTYYEPHYTIYQRRNNTIDYTYSKTTTDLDEGNNIFKGKVFAVLEKNSNKQDNALVQGSMELDIDKTKLRSENKLSLKFDNWYDFYVFNGSDGKQKVEVKEGSNYQDNGFVKSSSPSTFSGNTLFYGNDNIEEVVGNFYYNNNGWRLDGVYGAKKQ